MLASWPSCVVSCGGISSSRAGSVVVTRGGVVSQKEGGGSSKEGSGSVVGYRNAGEGGVGDADLLKEKEDGDGEGSREMWPGTASTALFQSSSRCKVRALS